MKFGQQLLESMPPDWKFYFVDYQGLKQYIKLNTQVKGPWNNNNEDQFMTMLEDEVKKVSSFEMVKRTELQRHIKFLENELDAIKGNASESQHSPEIKGEMDAVTTDLTKLAKFNSMNYTAFVKIIKKHDKYTGFRLKNTFMKQLNEAHFFMETYDDLVVKLSALYERFLPRDDWHEARIAVQKLQLLKHTFWVHPDNLTEVQCIILKHLPVFRTEKGAAAGPGKSVGSGGSDPAEEDLSISAVYLDTDTLELYNERLSKSTTSVSVRIRWFNDSRKHVYVERQTQDAVTSATGTARERFSLPEKYLSAYIKGEFDMATRTEKLKKKGLSQAEIKHVVQLAKEIQDTIQAKGLRPMLRTFARRTVFMVRDVPTLSCSIDNDVAMIREADRTEGGWMRPNVGDYPFNTLPDHEVALFPFSELVVRATDPMPEWVSKLCNSSLVERVPKFSKYLTGCAMVLEDRVVTAPDWMPKMKKDIRKPPTLQDQLLIETASEARGVHPEVAQEGKENVAEAENVFNMERRVSLSYTGTKDRKQGVPVPSSTGVEDGEEEDDEMGSLRARKLRNVQLLSSLLTRFPSVPSVTRGLVSAKPAAAYKKPIAIPVRVEPKVFFANERTFLHWTKVSVMISTLGLALLHAPPSAGNAARAAGYLMVPIAMVLCVYALYTFMWRDFKINHRDPGPYSAPLGPVMVAVTFGFSVLMNYFMWAAEHGGSILG